ncbi:nitrous oxide reductase accessory protein NosL [Leptospira perdikensis]|uniref:Accessory protein NosL n=1 Tax=Leptospira perdikensis TaxID=2484948 RepID=A0A4R9JIV1_9LEPT|nr:nitrous oxide reductase accessory protein NosL [Leptospira perdikensis]TGL44590.1 accessory protein NosL [Leptospira perdikensis]
MCIKSLRLICIFLIVGFINCGEVHPEKLIVGEMKCSHCSMNIVDMRFHTQIITYKGKRYHFDAIECMNQFQKDKQLRIEKIWVTNYLDQNEFLLKEKATIIQSSKIRSPMGAGFAAFKTYEDSIPFQN